MLVLGLAGETVANQLGLGTTVLLLFAALLVLILLVVNVWLRAPSRPPGGADVAFIFPLYWGTFFPLGILAGLLLGLGLLRLLSDGYIGGILHTYELAGGALGMLVVLALAFRRAPIPGAAFGLGYGLALPSAILLLDPANTPSLTYGGHLSFMVVVTALVVLFGRYVRIRIVD
jgi:hypothetical protein